MPRPLRVELADGVHHVWARRNNRERLFLDDVDRRSYLEGLRRTVAWGGWRCLAYVLMSNHVHFVVQTPRPNLGRGMQSFHGRWAMELNRRHGRVGHVFEGRFQSKLIRTDAQLLWTVAYVARNPVGAGLAPTPGQWEWGSHAWIARGEAPDWLDLELLAEHFGGLRRYLDFVDADPDVG